MRKIAELAHEVEAALAVLAQMRADGTLPPVLEPLALLVAGGSPDVELCHEDGRRIRSDASVDHWDPHECGIWIKFRAPDAMRSGPSHHESSALADAARRLRDLLRVIDKTERDPALNFISLKYLRDRVLPDNGLPWANDPEVRQSVIAEAIQRGALSTSKRPNPKNPQFPVTAIHLHREHPLVVEAIGGDQDRSFTPIEVRGAPVSDDILRGRR